FWKVVPYNTFGDATDCPVWSFTTRLDPIRPIPYTQDFNAATTWPTDWVNNGMSISASHGNGGNGVYKNLWSSSASGSFASCPIGPLAAVSEIKFDYRYMAYTGYPGAAHTLAAGDKIEVQISTNDGQTYETIHTIDMDNHTTSNQFATPTVPVIGYEGQIVRVRFLATRGAGDYFVDFDNIIVRETPASPVFAINPEEKDFGVAYMPAGSAPQTFTISNDGLGTLVVNSVAIGGADATEFLLTDTNTYPVSLLTNETITVQVKLNPTSAGEKIAALNIAYNDGSAATFAAPLTGNAVNPIITTFPYTDSFELNNTHNSTNVFYWTQERVGTTTKYWTVNSTETTYNRTPRTGLFDVTLQYSANAWLFRPAQLVAGTSYSIEVYGRQDGAVPTNASLTLKYGDSPEAAAMTGSIVDLTPLVNGEYQRLRGAFIPETSGYYYFGILGTINSSPYYITIDDFMIEETPAIVPNPAVLVSPANAALNVPVLATLSWVPAAEGGDPTAYELYVGTTELPALPTANLTETSYTFTTPLEYGTEYIWQVVPKNATGSAANCPVWSFKTMEDPTVTTFPFTEGFEGTQFPPLGWSQISVTGSKPWIRNTGTKHSGNASAQGQWE
ncbi:MAG TPA: choice-of-anchor D domain-containing protein, partial [Candidatus Cloacimonadota bacterium]|nr:choice-of-anchor D domain-containing protein [Candidatus Cloacimonadota bacterium]